MQKLITKKSDIRVLLPKLKDFYQTGQLDHFWDTLGNEVLAIK